MVQFQNPPIFNKNLEENYFKSFSNNKLHPHVSECFRLWQGSHQNGSGLILLLLHSVTQPLCKFKYVFFIGSGYVSSSSSVSAGYLLKNPLYLRSKLGFFLFVSFPRFLCLQLHSNSAESQKGGIRAIGRAKEADTLISASMQQHNGCDKWYHPILFERMGLPMWFLNGELPPKIKSW